MSLRDKLPKELENAYHVKLVRKSDGEVLFGELSPYAEDAEKLWDADRILHIDEAVTGALYRVKYDNWDFKKIPLNEFPAEDDEETGFSIYNEYDRFVNDAFKKAIKKHKAAGDGVKKGKLLSIGVADGSAYYEIVRVNKLTCSIEWRGFGLDRYIDRRWGYAHKVPHDEAEMYLCGGMSGF